MWEKQAQGLGMVPQFWHPRNCSHRFIWAKGFKPMNGKAGVFLTSSSPKKKRAMGNDAAGGGRGRTWLSPRRQNAALGPGSSPPSRRCEASPLALAPSPAQNYLLLPRRPQAKSKEVHSLSRQSGEAGTRVSTSTAGRAGARPCPGAEPMELLEAQGPAEQQPGPGLGCQRPPRLSRTPQGPGPRGA